MADNLNKKIKLADGTLIDTRTGKGTPSTAINDLFIVDPGNTISGRGKLDDITRRYIDDLPVPGIQSNPIACVVGYTIFGLADPDIAYLLKVDVEQIRNMKLGPAYQSFLNAMLQNIRQHDKNSIRKKINNAAEKATDKIVRLVDSPDQKVALAAAKDVLDRAGHSVRDNDPRNNDIMAGITIRILDETKEKKIQIDLDGADEDA